MTAAPFSCALIGGQSLLVQCAELLRQNDHLIRCILSSDPAVLRWAAEHDIRSGSDRGDLLEQLGDEPIDYLFSIANFRVLPEAVVASAGRMAINFHDGPLPAYAGLNVTSWALLNQETTHGISWHQIAKGIDQGDLLKTKEFPISADETAFSLNTKCFEAGIECFEELIPELAEQRVQPRAQGDAEGRYFGRKKRPSAAGFLDWREPADKCAALVRALDYGPFYRNPLCCAKLLVDGRIFLVGSAEVLETQGKTQPGTLKTVTELGLVVATATADLRLGDLRSLGGTVIADLRQEAALQPGKVLPPLPADRIAGIDRTFAEIAMEEAFWLEQLRSFEPQSIPPLNGRDKAPGAQDVVSTECVAPRLAIPDTASGQAVLSAAVLLFLARLGNTESLNIPVRTAKLHNLLKDGGGLCNPWLPLALAVDYGSRFEDFVRFVATSCEALDRHRAFANDLIARDPELRARASLVDTPLPVAIVQLADLPGQPASSVGVASGSFGGPRATLTIEVAESGDRVFWRYDSGSVAKETVQRMAARFASLLAELNEHPDRRIGEISILSAQDRQVLDKFRLQFSDYPRACVHHLIEDQVARTPDAVALVCGEQSLTYRVLDARANQIAHLLRAKGAAPGQHVGVLLERSADMLLAMLAVLKSGAAYVPLDPGYPKDRLAFMAQDAGLCCLVTGSDQQALIADPGIPRIVVDDAGEIEAQPVTTLLGGATPDDLAYMIYTSGSTGKPKGVMVEHRNVANFFAGMDRAIQPRQPGVWLAVTSISFDISVLELLWTLARGFKVILYVDPNRAQAQRLGTRYPERRMQFSLFYWNVAGDGDEESDYRLLIESARFGDENGFSAVWTPERHFGSFGGLYPNPAVTSAAVAAITRRIDIRAGSCVVPLHDPIRIAEEWSMVDRLSGGRVGLAAAAGWMPNDFVIRPENHAKAKQVMFESIETVQRLWRGETIEREGPLGKTRIAIRPRPVQPTLPLWITTAGSADTFVRAARMGANVLTHLLGQSVEGVAKNIQLYRQTWAECGHPGAGLITLLLHTLVGDDEDQVRENARQPMKRYLASAVSLVKDAAWEFPTYEKLSSETGKTLDEFFENISGDDMDGLLEFAFNRYYRDSGLFGSPRRCMEMVDRLKEIGVDDIGCLIDFGIDTKTVLDHLPDLNRVRQAAERPLPGSHAAIGTLIERHGVTHIQCTPSQAAMLVGDDETRSMLGRVETLLVGGEALPGDLAGKLKHLVGGQVINMYGPTETTVWSATHRVQSEDARVPLGNPILNTRLYILDNRQQPLPPGVPGELVIAGEGVVRGYHQRPELTAERFVADRLTDRLGARMYRTGDLACITPEGTLDFLGRMDFQVKVRGYRIELGEIEHALRRHADVRDAVALVREDRPGDQQLVAYLTAATGHALNEQGLREMLAGVLPEFMQPVVYVMLDAMPLTPNGKVDRKALPAPRNDAKLAREEGSYAAPASDLETVVAQIWRQVLGRAEIGVRDNFFDLGGHSLLVIQVLQLLRKQTERPVQLTDLFRFPTIQALASHLERDEPTDAAVTASKARGEARRSSLSRRRAARLDK